MEVGPGLGVLSEELAGQAGWVFTIELDDKLAAILERTLASFNNITIINEDILKIDPAALLEEHKGTEAVAEIEPLVNELVNLEIPATWVQAPLPLDSGGKLLVKLVGLVITAIAASRGSSFWYDMLKRVNPASSVKKSSATS